MRDVPMLGILPRITVAASTCLSATAVALVGAAIYQFAPSTRAIAIVPEHNHHYVLVATAIFLAACVSSTVGFAFSAIAAAMILHLVPETLEAVQIMMVASIGIQAYSVFALRKTILWKSCLPFLLGGALTIPVGLYLLITSNPRSYALIIGLGLAAYGLYMLVRKPMTIKAGGTITDTIVGALGGVTGPLAAFPGAFVTIWCASRGWDKTKQRSVYQPYILVMQLLTLGALAAVTGQARIDLTLFGYAFPGLAGSYVGMRLFQRLSDCQFNSLVNVALVLSGLALAINR